MFREINFLISVNETTKCFLFFLINATARCELWSAQRLPSKSLYPIHSSSSSRSSLSADLFVYHLPIWS
jgi:hypothetical protein